VIKRMNIGKSAVALLASAAVLSTLVKRRRRYSLAGKNVVIAGGSRGLGLVLAREALQRGASVAILARDKIELSRAHEQLSQLGNRVIAVPCDITNRSQVARAMDDIAEKLGPVDVLINNAGLIQVGPMDAMSTEDYRESLDVHFWGPLYSCLAVLPEMRERREGRIVNISSIGGKVSVPHLLPYAVGKFALAGFSQGLRAELLKDRVYVTSVYPGLMRTGSPRNADFKGKHRAEHAWFTVSDSLPGLTVSAEQAAREILDACESGRAELIISAPAKAAVKFNQVFPELSSEALGLAARLLPGPGKHGQKKFKGKDSSSRVTNSWVTLLTRRAALNNNEVA
jgi:short-subunit dehydrogenase